MEVSLRRQLAGPDGIPEYVDSVVSAQFLTIGSAADQRLQLLGRAVLPAHAVIRDGGAPSISARGRADLTVNGRRTRSGPLVTGDVIEIGRHRITVAPPPPGFDLALTVEPDTATAKSEYEGAFRTELDQTWLSKRRFTWTLLIVTPLLVFLIPFIATLAHRGGADLPSLVPDDQMWTAGPLIPAHEQAAARRCEACHKSFFSVVQDGACRECHKAIMDHVTPQRLTQTRLGPADRCGTCHQEHNAAGGQLVARSNTLCVDCHESPDPAFGALKVAAVSGFSGSDHPAFQATVLRPKVIPAAQLADLPQRDTPAEGSEALLWQPVRVPVTGGLETSNLKFSHAQHLDNDRVQRATDNKALECADCHVLTPDGTRFEPITMAGVCGSCHELTFDPTNPQRQLAHGKPKDAILTIQDYYAHKYLEPGAVPEEARRPQHRRMPDEDVVEQSCQAGTPAQRGQCRAELEVMTQFTRRGCVSCHEVNDAGRSSALQERFTVRPVRLVANYLPGVHFSHRAHAVQRNLTGQAACLSCHPAMQSEDSSRLMIPDRGRCLACHGETPARDRVQLQCVSCHEYHADHSERPSPQSPT